MLEVRRDHFAGALCGSRRRDGEAGSDDDSFEYSWRLLSFAQLPQRLAASDFVRHLARWRFQLKAYRHAVEGIHIGNDGGQIHDLAIIKVMA